MALTTATTLALVAIAASAAGTYVAYDAQQQQAKAAEKAGEYNAKVAENNSQAAADQAQFEAEKLRRRNRYIIGKQKAMVAKAGVLDSGSMFDVFMDSAIQGELDVMAAIYSGNVRSSAFESQAILSRAEGSSAAAGYRNRSYATILTGVSSAAGSGYSMYRDD